MILILEDNLAKIENIFLKYKELCEQHAIFICKTESEAKAFCRQYPELKTLFIDQELGGGNFGIAFLEWALQEHAHWIEKVYPTSFSKDACRTMHLMCERKSIPCERANL